MGGAGRHEGSALTSAPTPKSEVIKNIQMFNAGEGEGEEGGSPLVNVNSERNSSQQLLLCIALLLLLPGQHFHQLLLCFFFSISYFCLNAFWFSLSLMKFERGMCEKLK